MSVEFESIIKHAVSVRDNYVQTHIVTPDATSLNVRSIDKPNTGGLHSSLSLKLGEGDAITAIFCQWIKRYYSWSWHYDYCDPAAHKVVTASEATALVERMLNRMPQRRLDPSEFLAGRV